MGKFHVTKRTNGDLQFNLKATNGQVILTSQGYSSRDACMNGIDSVKKHAKEEKNFHQETAKDGKYYFNLKASNGQIIGNSEIYESETGLKKGMKSVMENAPNAEIVEE